VAFCGHATIATAVALAEREGTGNLRLVTSAGEVRVGTRPENGRILATLTSVAPAVREAGEADLASALTALHWQAADLDPKLPPRIANAGNDHLVLAASSRARLAALDYDQEALGDLMARRAWTTLHLVWRETGTIFHARDPFPPGGVVEDPATGAAAAAFGAYLRSLKLVTPPVRVTIHQGEDMGRPSRLLVDVPAGDGSGIKVSGTAAPLTS
jgi:PhzF family phenazine biosynthesis protein